MRKIIEQYSSHERVRLMVGDGGIYQRPSIVTTVLGSCVSVTFFCRPKKIGAIFHALLPVMPDKEKKNLTGSHFKYVNSSINRILHVFKGCGVKPNQIEAKLFGGSQSLENGLINTGVNNIMTAYEVLAANDIKILASDVGGEMGRNLVFITDTGEVFVKNHKRNIFKTNRKAMLPHQSLPDTAHLSTCN